MATIATRLIVLHANKQGVVWISFSASFCKGRLLQLRARRLSIIGELLLFLTVVDFVHTSVVIHAESPACSLKSLRASGGLDGIDAGFCGAPGRCGQRGKQFKFESANMHRRNKLRLNSKVVVPPD